MHKITVQHGNGRCIFTVCNLNIRRIESFMLLCKFYGWNRNLQLCTVYLIICVLAIHWWIILFQPKMFSIIGSSRHIIIIFITTIFKVYAVLMLSQYQVVSWVLCETVFVHDIVMVWRMFNSLISTSKHCIEKKTLKVLLSSIRKQRREQYNL